VKKDRGTSLTLTVDLVGRSAPDCSIWAVLGSRPLDAPLQASKEDVVPSTLKHPINAANLAQLLDEFEKDLVAAGGFAASSPRPR
jgi:hypothetical protein